MAKKKMEGWEDWMDEELANRKHDAQYGTVVRSPNRVVHILKDEDMDLGDSGTTLCGQEFVADSSEQPDNTKWELYEDFFFGGTDCITCKKCRVLETDRMKMEILEGALEEARKEEEEIVPIVRRKVKKAKSVEKSMIEKLEEARNVIKKVEEERRERVSNLETEIGKLVEDFSNASGFFVEGIVIKWLDGDYSPGDQIECGEEFEIQVVVDCP